MTAMETTPSVGRSTNMTDRQLASMTRYGRRVTFLCPDLDADVIGYVIGFDDDNVRIASVVTDGGTPRIEVVLRHRNYIAGMDAEGRFSAKNEPLAVELESMLAPFRRFVMTKYFPEHASS